MSAIGFFILFNLSDVYPYQIIAASCLVEASIYFRFLRMTVCPSQVHVIMANFFPIFGFQTVTNKIIYKYFEFIIVFFAGQIYAHAFVNLSL